MIDKKLESAIKTAFSLPLDSAHGLKHWQNVAKIGKYLAQETGADSKVVELFAYLHDSKRENGDHDKNHGLRASEFVRALYDKELIKITEEQFWQLNFACKYHNQSALHSDDITIQICWDADRLDLWRFGIEPEKEFLNTDFAKRDEAIEFARQLNSMSK